jgi:sterol desaturase/sphingolipid hydroxylase (fatty acid hydroxylase superfamily)
VAALAVAALQLASPALGLGVGVPWPHHWPVVGQVALMLVAADGARYWLHRLSHSWQPLWRLHAVHHSPRRLYWLNVARFHPAEKALQLVVDSLPFVLIGVDELVLAGYFVFYAVNGFFQHSNCRVRLGPLNHLISGPELHRWHHSTVVAESSSNFGNNLIVWDVLFGTRFLPPDRVVADLGIEGGVASDA